MPTRRSFLAAAGSGLAGAALAAPAFNTRAIDIARELKKQPGQPQQIAGNESYWSQVARAFTVDRSIINLNNGSVSPSPVVVQDVMKRYLDFCNTAIPAHALWGVLHPQKEGTRRALAQSFGGDAEELAITRNTSESLQILQFGLPLAAGDEVLTTTADYPRMIQTFQQRERREGIKLVRFQVPVPTGDADPARFNAEVVRLYEAHITPRTRMILCSHMGFLNGGVLPVKDICALGRRHNIPVIVDAAHSLAHLDFRIPDLECEYLGVSLHKWLCAPHGTGLLYVKRDRIKSVWPLMAATEAQDDNIRKFEEIGTHPAANHLAIAEAITFHDGIGAARKAARLVFLRDLWVSRLTQGRFADRVKIHTGLAPGMAGGIATVEIDGFTVAELRGWLLASRQVFTTPVDDGAETPSELRHNVRGLRISPNVYTTPSEIERFCEAVEEAMEFGIV